MSLEFSVKVQVSSRARGWNLKQLYNKLQIDDDNQKRRFGYYYAAVPVDLKFVERHQQHFQEEVAYFSINAEYTEPEDWLEGHQVYSIRLNEDRMNQARLEAWIDQFEGGPLSLSSKPPEIEYEQ